jgi:hypothetical protein
MISYFLPPLGGIASLRAWRFATLLPETGWEPTLVSPGRGDYVADGALTVPPHRVVRTRSVELSRLIRRPVRRLEGLAEGAGTERRRLIDVARHAIRRWVYRPDAQIGWYPFALAAARRVVRQSDVRAIFSSAFPITAHLVARRLHRETGIPWVAEFRDLWSDWGGNGRRRQRWDEALERSLLEEAAAAVTVSPTYAEVLAARGGGRVEVLTNAFDSEDFQGAPALVQDTVAHLGTYYAGRQDLETVIEALGGLVSGGALPSARLRFIGECPRSLRPAIHRAGLADKVDESGFVPHQEAVAQLARSRVLAFGGPVSCDSPALKGNVAA